MCRKSPRQQERIGNPRKGISASCWGKIGLRCTPLWLGPGGETCAGTMGLVGRETCVKKGFDQPWRGNGGADTTIFSAMQTANLFWLAYCDSRAVVATTSAAPLACLQAGKRCLSTTWGSGWGGAGAWFVSCIIHLAAHVFDCPFPEWREKQVELALEECCRM